MSFFRNCVRYLAYPNYRHKVIASSFKKNPQCYRNIHCTSILSVKMYKEFENQYAYHILENKGYAVSLNSNIESRRLTEEQFTNILKMDWSSKPAAEVFEVFSTLSVYCAERNVCISNDMFDNYVDILTDSIKFATDEELKSIFYCLDRWPDTPSIRTRNYIEVWAALDDECLNRSKNWSYDQLLSYIGLFYMLNVTRYSDFCTKSLNKLSTKAKYLSPGQIVQTLFFVGITRRSPFDMHNLEIRLNNIFSEFSIDDLAIMSMGFFKSKTPIRDPDLVLKIANMVIENAKTVHEVSLAALLKIIRYSTKVSLDDRIYRVMDTLQYEVPRLSVMCNVHLALLGTSTINYHKECLSKIAENLVNKLQQTRLKDLERLILTYATFNFTPPTRNFFNNILAELRKPERGNEIKLHGRSFACCIAYFSVLKIYPEDLINQIMTKEFLDNAYGKVVYNYGKEILVLQHTIDLHCKNVQNRLCDKSVKILANKYTDFVPSEEFKKQYNITEKMVLDILKILRETRGGHQYVIGDHILPHHQRGDIIVCDDHNGAPVDIQHVFAPNSFGLLRKPPNDLNWTVLVIAGRNAIIYGTDTPTGPFLSKIHDLETLGYSATLVPWSVYSNIKTAYEKAEYLNSLIKNCQKRIKKIKS